MAMSGMIGGDEKRYTYPSLDKDLNTGPRIRLI
jgi:hypothetical protein